MAPKGPLHRLLPGVVLALSNLLGSAAAQAQPSQLVNPASVETANVGLLNQVSVFCANEADFGDNGVLVGVRVIDPAEVVSTVVTQADLELSKTADPAEATAGDEVTYRLEVENLGPSSAQDVGVGDLLPPEVTFVSHTVSSGGSCLTPPAGSTGAVSCDWPGSTGPGVVRSVDVVVQVAVNAPSSTVENGATVSSSTPDPAPDNDTAVAGLQVTALSLLEIPTLSPAAILLFTGLLAACGLLALRRVFPGA